MCSSFFPCMLQHDEKSMIPIPLTLDSLRFCPLSDGVIFLMVLSTGTSPFLPGNRDGGVSIARDHKHHFFGFFFFCKIEGERLLPSLRHGYQQVSGSILSKFIFVGRILLEDVKLLLIYQERQTAKILLPGITESQDKCLDQQIQNL